MNTDRHSWLILIFILFILIDFTVINPGLLFLLFFAVSFIYFGKKNNKLFGRLFFWLGILFLIITIFSSVTFKIAIFALLIYAIVQYFQAKEETKIIEPTLVKEKQTISGEVLIKKQAFLKNLFFGNQKTPISVYEWNDTHIQTGIGNCEIDLSNTVMPDEVAVISIQGIVGNITIYVPYEVDVQISHSAVTGRLKIFHHEIPKVFNESVTYQTENFDQSLHKIKILTSIISGNVEVKRI